MTIQDTVKKYLELDPRTRDNDKLLTALIWHEELAGEGDFLKMYAHSNKLTAADTITRARRKLQEDNEHLRGRSYQGRQTKQEEVRKDLNTLFN